MKHPPPQRCPPPSFYWPQAWPLNLSTEMQSRYHHPHFADEETKAQGIYKHSHIHRLLSGFSRMGTHFYRIFQPALSTTIFTTAPLFWVLYYVSLKGWDLFF